MVTARIFKTSRRAATVRIPRLGALLIVLALAAAACGGGTTDDGANNTPDGSADTGDTGDTQSGDTTTADFEDERPIQMATWGGLSAKAFGKGWGGAFAEATGVDYDTSPIMDYAKWQTQIESGETGWDWGDFEGYFPLAHPDLFMDLDLDRIGVTAEDMVQLKNPEDTERLLTDKTVASYISAYVLSYNTDRHETAPKGFAEFFDTETFPGVRSLYNYPYGMLEVALIADGVTFDEMYPLDYDRAFAKLDTLGDDLVFWNSGAESQQQLTAGSADFVVTWNGRVIPLAQQGIPVEINWEDNIMIMSSHAIPANTDRPNVLHDFIRTALLPEHQAYVSNLLATGPTVEGGYELIDEDVKPWIPTHPDNVEKSFGMINDKWWAENFSEASGRWSEWVNSR